MTNKTTTIKPQKKRTAEHLKPYQFKPGNNANPKGRPKQLLSKKERLLLLSEIAKHEIEKPVTAGHKIAAIREHNLMEHIYDDKPQYQDNRTYNILVQGDEQRDRFNKLLEGKRPEIIDVEKEGE